MDSNSNSDLDQMSQKELEEEYEKCLKIKDESELDSVEEENEEEEEEESEEKESDDEEEEKSDDEEMEDDESLGESSDQFGKRDFLNEDNSRSSKSIRQLSKSSKSLGSSRRQSLGQSSGSSRRQSLGQSAGSSRRQSLGQSAGSSRRQSLGQGSGLSGQISRLSNKLPLSLPISKKSSQGSYLQNRNLKNMFDRSNKIERRLSDTGLYNKSKKQPIFRTGSFSNLNQKNRQIDPFITPRKSVSNRMSIPSSRQSSQGSYLQKLFNNNDNDSYNDTDNNRNLKSIFDRSNKIERRLSDTGLYNKSKKQPIFKTGSFSNLNQINRQIDPFINPRKRIDREKNTKQSNIFNLNPVQLTSKEKRDFFTRENLDESKFIPTKKNFTLEQLDKISEKKSSSPIIPYLDSSLISPKEDEEEEEEKVSQRSKKSKSSFFDSEALFRKPSS